MLFELCLEQKIKLKLLSYTIFVASYIWLQKIDNRKKKVVQTVVICNDLQINLLTVWILNNVCFFIVNTTVSRYDNIIDNYEFVIQSNINENFWLYKKLCKNCVWKYFCNTWLVAVFLLVGLQSLASADKCVLSALDR